MFGEDPHHDIAPGAGERSARPESPSAGFFAMGEIGPVGGRNFLHGFTASVAVFRARQAEESKADSVRSSTA